MNHGNWKRGKPIPKKYRNRLYEWEGGGYDGCFWEMNQGVVTDDGHWDPFHSTGRNGLDCDEWYEDQVRRLKMTLGFSVDRYGMGEDVDAWFASVKYRAQEEARKRYYGEHYHDNPEYFDSNAEPGHMFVDKYREQVEKDVAEKTKDDAARYSEYRARRKEIDDERHARLDEVFMDQVKAQSERPPNLHSWDYSGPAREQWLEYPLDDENVKKSCERFCREYSGTVGVMAAVLDALRERGYDVWCTCSDCGEQFQLEDYEKFSHLVDENCYHGDGGIGCIFTRVQCEECRRNTECPKCYEPSLPTAKDLKEGHAYDRWSFGERFVGIWLGVCDSCAYNFLSRDEYKHWNEDIDAIEEAVDRGKAQLDKYAEAMRESGKTAEEVDALCEKNLVPMRKEWAALFNELRHRMRKDVEEHFSDCMDWASHEVAESGLKEYL